MTRAIRPASIQSAVDAAYRAVGGMGNAATDLGLSQSTLSYGIEVSEQRPGGLGVNYLDRLGRIEPRAARPLADHFCHLAGGVFLPISYRGAMATDVAALTREFSEVLTNHAIAHGEGSINPDDYTPSEAARQIKDLHDVVAVAVDLIAALEGKL